MYTHGAHSSSNMYIFHACALGSRLSYWAGFRNGDVIPEFVRVDACDPFTLHIISGLCSSEHTINDDVAFGEDHEIFSVSFVNDL